MKLLCFCAVHLRLCECPLRGQTQSVLLSRHLHLKDFIITLTTKTQTGILSYKMWILFLIRVVHLCPVHRGPLYSQITDCPD